MRYLVVGLGNMGRKRRALLGPRCVATADPINAEAQYRRAEDCAHERFDAVVLTVPNDAKLPLLEHFLTAGRHVLVEKPLPLPDRAVAERLNSLAHDRNVI